MHENLTAKFDTLSQAEAAATKLQTIRAKEVDISNWSGGQASNDYTADYHTAMMGLSASVGNFYPSMGSGLSSAGYGPYSFAVSGEVQGGTNEQGYLLNALISAEQREMAIRIIRDCGGNEI